MPEVEPARLASRNAAAEPAPIQDANRLDRVVLVAAVCAGAGAGDGDVATGRPHRLRGNVRVGAESLLVGPSDAVRPRLDQRFLVCLPARAVQDLRVSPAPHAMGSPGSTRPVHDQHGMAAQTSLGDETRGHPPVCRCPLAHPALLQCHAGSVRPRTATASHQHRTLGFFPLRAAGQGPGLAGRLLVVGHGRFVGLPRLRPVAASLGNRLPRRSPPILRPQTLGDLCRQFAHRRSRLRAPVRRLRSLSA